MIASTTHAVRVLSRGGAGCGRPAVALRLLLRRVSSSLSKETGHQAAVVSYLVVGLGNPGKAFADTRHNVGFRVVDALAASYGVRMRQGMQALANEGKREEDEEEEFYGCKDVHLSDDGGDGDVVRLHLLKPGTFMNRSGVAVVRAMRTLQIPVERTMVVYDDIFFPLGTVRLANKGGAARHKGADNVMHKVGSKRQLRMRVGVFPPEEPKNFITRTYRGGVKEFVLRRFLPDERKILFGQVYDRCVDIVHDWLEGASFVQLTNRWHATSPRMKKQKV